LLPDGRVLVTGGEDLIIRRALVASRGREVKHTGDGIMASFDDVAHALECAAARRLSGIVPAVQDLGSESP
jgi:class 3 adenylate cyclase